MPKSKTGGRARARIASATAVSALGLALVLALALVALADYPHKPGGLMTAVGALLAMVGTYLCLLLMVLTSRLPWVERAMGHDKMVFWHRKLAPYSLFLIGLHVVFTTLGYAQRFNVSLVNRFVGMVQTFPWMLPALVSVLLMIALGISSYRRVRSKLKYETWAVAHLYFYIAVALGFGHQIESGTLLAGAPVLKGVWIGLYVLVAAVILVSRFALPIAFSIRHQLRVASVVEETPGTVSVYLTGRNLESIRAQGGQFFQWRFVTRHWWWQAHPYSLSAAPNRDWLRITVKALGDQSAALQQLRPGTRVIAEGPYGVFTADRRTSDSVVAFAAGVGVTPIRAMLEHLPAGADVTVIYRVLEADQAPLAEEMLEIAQAKDLRVHVLAGLPEAHPLTWDYLSQYAPNLESADWYVCGPAGFTAGVRTLAATLGVPAKRFHHEAFAF